MKNFIRQWVFLIIAVILVVTGSLLAKNYDDTNITGEGTIRLYHQVTVTYHHQTKKMSLPRSIKPLSPRSQVVVDFTITGSPGDQLYLKSVYAPFKVYANNTLIYHYGEQSSRPSFMKDPACLIDAVGLPLSKNNEKMHIKIVYRSLKSRSNLALKACGVGTNKQIISYIKSHYGFSRGIAVVFLILGIYLVFFALFFFRDSVPVKRLFYSGLLIALAGIWLYCVNDLTIFLGHRYNIYYLLGFPCMFMLMCPITRFVSVQLGDRKGKMIPAILGFNELSCLLAIILQLLGIVDYATSFYYFMIMESISLLIVVSIMGYHTHLNHRTDDRMFFISCMTLMVFVVLALTRRYLGYTSDLIFVPVGFFLFVIILMVYLQALWKKMIHQQEKAIVLENDMRQLESAIDASKQHNALLVAHAEEVREARHDLRHHLLVLRQMVDDHNYEGLKEYVSSMTNSMPVNRSITYCDNVIINALLSYYVERAEKLGVRLDLQVQFPAHLNRLSDNVLSVIVGNLVENGLEACMRMKDGDRFIIFRSKVQGDMLIISMDNSFDGQIRKQEGQFVSSKVADGSRIGTGLRSVASLAHKYQGDVEFHSEGAIFYSSVYLKM